MVDGAVVIYTCYLSLTYGLNSGHVRGNSSAFSRNIFLEHSLTAFLSGSIVLYNEGVSSVLHPSGTR